MISLKRSDLKHEPVAHTYAQVQGAATRMCRANLVNRNSGNIALVIQKWI